MERTLYLTGAWDTCWWNWIKEGRAPVFGVALAMLYSATLDPLADGLAERAQEGRGGPSLLFL